MRCAQFALLSGFSLRHSIILLYLEILIRGSAGIVMRRRRRDRAGIMIRLPWPQTRFERVNSGSRAAEERWTTRTSALPNLWANHFLAEAYSVADRGRVCA